MTIARYSPSRFTGLVPLLISRTSRKTLAPSILDPAVVASPLPILLYVTVWRSGKFGFDHSGPSSSALSCRLSYQPDVLQDHIPVLAFLRREVSFDNQVTSSHAAGVTRYHLTNYL